MITHVAIHYNHKYYSLPAPNRHHNVIRMIAAENGVGIQGPDVQGFLRDGHKFLNRKQAMNHAIHVGQVQGKERMTELFSEDLW